jgi:hypothetical protein
MSTSLHTGGVGTYPWFRNRSGAGLYHRYRKPERNVECARPSAGGMSVEWTDQGDAPNDHAFQQRCSQGADAVTIRKSAQLPHEIYVISSLGLG